MPRCMGSNGPRAAGTDSVPMRCMGTGCRVDGISDASNEVDALNPGVARMQVRVWFRTLTS